MVQHAINVNNNMQLTVTANMTILHFFIKTQLQLTASSLYHITAS